MPQPGFGPKQLQARRAQILRTQLRQHRAAQARLYRTLHAVIHRIAVRQVRIHNVRQRLIQNRVGQRGGW
jgi:hypothetical protein